MRNLDFKKIVCVLAFLGLAGFSCFWTAESLFIWQPEITIYGAWFIAIAFFLMASVCFSKVLQTFDKNIYFGGRTFGRGGQFFIGLVGFLIFWSVSLATNTHTLLYRASIKSVINTDLNRTLGYLQGLQDNNLAIKKIEEKFAGKKNAVDALIRKFIAEIDNPDAKGIGPRFKTILAELSSVLGVTIKPIDNQGSTRTQWLTTINYYQKQAYEQLGLYRADCDREINEIRRAMNAEELNKLLANMKIALSDINDKMQGINQDIINAALRDLSAGYSYIRTNSQYIGFKDNDKERYTREGAIPESQEMFAIDKVWRDYLTTNKYDGHGFIWWVLVSILVDLSGFIFFNMAFEKNKNNAI